MLRQAALICIFPIVLGSTVTLSQQAPMPRVVGGIVLAQRTDRPASLPKIKTGTCADMIGCFLIRPDDWSSFRKNVTEVRPIFDAYLKADGSSTMTLRANGVASPVPDWVEADLPTFCKGNTSDCITINGTIAVDYVCSGMFKEKLNMKRGYNRSAEEVIEFGAIASASAPVCMFAKDSHADQKIRATCLSEKACEAEGVVILIKVSNALFLTEVKAVKALGVTSNKNSEICFAPDSSLDERKAGCSVVIESGSESGRTLAMAFCNRGHVLIEEREYDQAIADLNRAIGIDPGYACSYNNRGRAFGFKGDYNRALADYNQAIHLDPKFALAYNNRVDVWLHNGDLDRTIEDLSTAIRLDPKFVLAYTNRCRAWSAKGNFARAIADCNQAIVLAPGNPTIYLLRGGIFRDVKKYDNAIADYSEVIRLAPNNADGWRNRGLIWLLKYDDDRRIADYDQAIRLDPTDADSYNNRGQAHLAKGHRVQAIADFRKALELQPGLPDPLEGLKRLGVRP